MVILIMAEEHPDFQHVFLAHFKQFINKSDVFAIMIDVDFLSFDFILNIQPMTYCLTRRRKFLKMITAIQHSSLRLHGLCDDIGLSDAMTACIYAHM